MTFTEYYIEQAKDLKLAWKCAKEFKEYRKFFCVLRDFLSPRVVRMMYLYDTGKMKPDKRYLEGKREDEMTFSLDEIDFIISVLYHEQGWLKRTVRPNDDYIVSYLNKRLDKCETLLEKFKIQKFFMGNYE